MVNPDDKGAGKVFRDENEAIMAYAEHVVTLQAPIQVRREREVDGVMRHRLVETTVGKIIFNNPIPQNLGYVDREDPEHMFDLEVDFQVTKKNLPDIISRCLTMNGPHATAEMLDHIKAQGYKYSTISAITVQKVFQRPAPMLQAASSTEASMEDRIPERVRYAMGKKLMTCTTTRLPMP